MPDPFSAFIRHFNAGNYRAGVEPLEEIWLKERDDFHKGLIRLCVALHQLELGLLTSPRFLLATAAELLEPYAPAHKGINVEALLEQIERCKALIPADVETGGGRVPTEHLPKVRIEVSN